MSASCLFCVVSFIPAATGVVQEAANPFMPSICTKHRRQEPKASSCSVAQSLGIFTSESAAARITEVPAGTVTSWPSMVRLTSSALSRFGVPKSLSTMDSMDGPCVPSTGGAGLPCWFNEILGKMVQGRDHRIGGQPPERAQRAVSQGFAQIAQNGLLLGRVFTGDEPI